jgi:hypothetical protein
LVPVRLLLAVILIGTLSALVARRTRTSAPESAGVRAETAGTALPRFAFRSTELPFRNVSGDPDQIPILDQNGQGVCVLDFDGDGLQDVYLVNGSTLARFAAGDNPGGALLRNAGDGSFLDVTDRAGSRGPAWGTGCAAADYDGDGWTDLFVAGWGGNRTYRNRGDGTFEDTTALAGLADGHWCSFASWADFDGDGRLDLFVSRYVRFDPASYPTTENGQPCTYRGVVTGCPPYDYAGEEMAVYRNLGDGRFEDVSHRCGVAAAAPYRGIGTVALRLFDDSRLPDVYVGCDVMPNLLFRDLGGFRFAEVAAERGAAMSADGRHESGMGVAVGDLHESGRPDLFITNFAGEKNTLYHNLGGAFADETVGTGLDTHRAELGWGNAVADLDNDGHEDAVVANGQIYPQVEELDDPEDSYAQPIRLFAGCGGGRFEEIVDPALSGRRSRRGLAVADFDNDGRLDLVTVTHNGAPQVFWNISAPRHHWIRFTLRGAKEREAPGTLVRVTFSGRVRAGWKLPNQGYQSSRDARVHFGIGNAVRMDSAEITWADGTIQGIGPLRADVDYEVVESMPPRELVLPAFRPMHE